MKIQAFRNLLKLVFIAILMLNVKQINAESNYSPGVYTWGYSNVKEDENGNTVVYRTFKSPVAADTYFYLSVAGNATQVLDFYGVKVYPNVKGLNLDECYDIYGEVFDQLKDIGGDVALHFAGNFIMPFVGELIFGGASMSNSQFISDMKEIYGLYNDIQFTEETLRKLLDVDSIMNLQSEDVSINIAGHSRLNLAYTGAKDSLLAATIESNGAGLGTNGSHTCRLKLSEGIYIFTARALDENGNIIELYSYPIEVKPIPGALNVSLFGQGGGIPDLAWMVLDWSFLVGNENAWDEDPYVDGTEVISFASVLVPTLTLLLN